MLGGSAGSTRIEVCSRHHTMVRFAWENPSRCNMSGGSTTSRGRIWIENIFVNSSWIEIMIVLTMLPIAMRSRLQCSMAMSMMVMVVWRCEHFVG